LIELAGYFMRGDRACCYDIHGWIMPWHGDMYSFIRCIK